MHKHSLESGETGRFLVPLSHFLESGSATLFFGFVQDFILVPALFVPLVSSMHAPHQYSLELSYVHAHKVCPHRASLFQVKLCRRIANTGNLGNTAYICAVTICLFLALSSLSHVLLVLTGFLHGSKQSFHLPSPNSDTCWFSKAAQQLILVLT